MAGFEEAVENVADTVGKAVVSISAEHTQKTGGVRRYYFGAPAPQDGPLRMNSSAVSLRTFSEKSRRGNINR